MRNDDDHKLPIRALPLSHYTSDVKVPANFVRTNQFLQGKHKDMNKIKEAWKYMQSPEKMKSVQQRNEN